MKSVYKLVVSLLVMVALFVMAGCTMYNPSTVYPKPMYEGKISCYYTSTGNDVVVFQDGERFSVGFIYLIDYCTSEVLSNSPERILKDKEYKLMW